LAHVELSYRAWGSQFQANSGYVYNHSLLVKSKLVNGYSKILGSF
jgi:hypothetical protein